MYNMDEEVFVDIKDYEGLYKISNHGRVYSINYGYILRPTSKSRLGHCRVALYKNKQPKFFLIHRLVLTHFNRSPENGEECRHLDGDPSNNNIDNLEWGTHKENENDKIVHGTLLKGENHPRSKFTKEQVIKIRELYKTGKYVQRELAVIFNVSRSSIRNVTNSRVWKHV